MRKSRRGRQTQEEKAEEGYVCVCAYVCSIRAREGMRYIHTENDSCQGINFEEEKSCSEAV